MFTATICFVFLALSVLSLWINKDLKVWGSLLIISLVTAFMGGFVTLSGLAILALFFGLWLTYSQKQLFSLLIILTLMGLALRLHFFPGFAPLLITPKFYLSLRNTLIGLFPLALLVPLAHTKKQWGHSLLGFLAGLGGIALLAILATTLNAVTWQPKIPSALALRAANNFIFVCIAEEGFYRGFIQNGLCKYFRNLRCGNLLSLIITSSLFTLSHFYWTPNAITTGFIFLAGLLFGAVYLFSKRIESAILTHFALNLVHMVFFSYHAM